jgi:superfamily I DNA and/or RNA helicase
LLLFTSRYAYQGKEEELHTSFANRDEISVLAGILDQIASNGKQLGSNTIGVISPYSAQISEIKTHLQNKKYFSSLEIQTVDGFQGREKDIIVFSAVRSNPEHVFGFLNDKRRINVSLSRAKHCLVIIGNAKMLSANPVWAQIIKYFKSHNAIYSPSMDIIASAF